jgi:hypothetical protein
MMPLSDAVDLIVRSALPLLLPDTCSLLDLMRDPAREDIHPANAKAAQRLLRQAAESPVNLSLCLPEQVLKELADNQGMIREETQKKIAKTNEALKRVSEAYAVHGLSLQMTGVDLRAHDFPSIANQFVEDIKSAAVKFQPTDETMRKAMARIAHGLAPNHRGGQYKDCIVIESNFELVRVLRARGFEEKVVFLTTNVSDYSAERGTIKVHADLVAEFETLQIEYATSFGLAGHLLGR